MTLNTPRMPRPKFPPWTFSAFHLIGPIGFLPPQLSKSLSIFHSAHLVRFYILCLKIPPRRKRTSENLHESPPASLPPPSHFINAK